MGTTVKGVIAEPKTKSTFGALEDIPDGGAPGGRWALGDAKAEAFWQGQDLEGEDDEDERPEVRYEVQFWNMNPNLKGTFVVAGI